MSQVVSPRVRQPDGPQVARKRQKGRRQFGNLRQLPSKRWQASYTGPDGKRHNAPTTFQTKGDASAWLSTQQARIVESRWKPPGPDAATTLATYAERWLAARELKPRTRVEYRRLLDAKILPGLGAIKLKDLRAIDVRTWHASLDPAQKTARAHSYSLLRTVLGTAVTEELLEINPARLTSAGSTSRAKAIRPATVPELDAIAAAMPAKYRLMVSLASWCALRFGEIAELRRHDVDLEAGVVHVRRAVTWADGEPVVGTPKSASGVRDVHVPPHLMPEIRAHLSEHAAAGSTGLLFPNKNGDHLHHGSLYKVYKPARVAAGRPDLRWHDLRHTGAVFAAQNGATLADVMGRLGHSTVGAAMRYQHASEDRDAQIARRLSEMVEMDQILTP